MSPTQVLAVATTLSLGLLLLAMLLTIVRIIRGPTLADRVLGLDMMTTLGIGAIGVIAIRTGFSLYLDIAIALGLVGFLSTVAFARYLITQAKERSSHPSGEIE